MVGPTCGAYSHIYTLLLLLLVLLWLRRLLLLMLKASAFLNHHHHYCCCNDDDVDDFNNGERSSKINITRVPPVPTEKTTTTRLGPHLGGHAHAVIQVNVLRSAFASFGGSYGAMVVGGAERVPNKTLSTSSSSSSNVLAILMHVGLSIRGCYCCAYAARVEETMAEAIRSILLASFFLALQSMY